MDGANTHHQALLVAWMDQGGLSQHILAIKLGCSEALISRFLRGERDLPVWVRLRFIGIFGLEQYKAIFGPWPVTPEVDLWQQTN